MTTIDIQTPSVVILRNVSETSKTFVPYKENFVTSMPADYSLELGVKTAGQALYYLQQATDGLTVSFGETEEEVDDSIAYENEVITMTNISDIDVDFMPYKENYSYTIKAGDTLKITADSVGQVLYYLAQATDKLTVTHEAG